MLSHSVTVDTHIADQTCSLTQSQQTHALQIKHALSLSHSRHTAGAMQGSQWSTNFQVTGMTRHGKRPTAKAGIEPKSAAAEMDALPLSQRGCQNCGKPASPVLQIVMTWVGGRHACLRHSPRALTFHRWGCMHRVRTRPRLNQKQWNQEYFIRSRKREVKLVAANKKQSAKH